MAAPKTMTRVWTLLDARWGLMLGQLYPEGFRKDDFLLSLADLEDGDLLRAVDVIRKTRETLYPHDNLVAIIRNAAGEARKERLAAEREAEDQARMDLREIEELQSKLRPLTTEELALAGAPDLPDEKSSLLGRSIDWWRQATCRRIAAFTKDERTKMQARLELLEGRSRAIVRR
jgi:hypothetical protein